MQQLSRRGYTLYLLVYYCPIGLGFDITFVISLPYWAIYFFVWRPFVLAWVLYLALLYTVRYNLGISVLCAVRALDAQRHKPGYDPLQALCRNSESTAIYQCSPLLR